MAKKKTDPTTRAMIIGVTAIFVFAIIYFLAQRNCPECPTGWQVLGMNGINFWGSAVFFSLCGFAAIWFLVRKVFNSGGVGVSLAYVAPIIIFFSIAFGKACTDKATDGVTSEKFKPTGPAKDGRVPAEELIKK